MLDPKRLKGKKAVGLIDDDKVKAEYIRSFEILKVSRHGLVLTHKKNTKHYLVVIKPGIDHWLFKAAEETGLQLSKYKLPTELSQFRKALKKQAIETSVGYKAFINDLRQKKSVRVLTLINLIKEAQNLK
jgi:hypothetical protein